MVDASQLVLVRRDTMSNLQVKATNNPVFTLLFVICVPLGLGTLYTLFRRNSHQNNGSRNRPISNEGPDRSSLQRDRYSDSSQEDSWYQNIDCEDQPDVFKSGMSHAESINTNLRKRTGHKVQSLHEMQRRVSIHNGKKQFDQAAVMQANFITEMKRVMGSEHPKTLDSMTKLTYIYRHQERYREARTLQEEIVQILKKTLGEDHPSILNHMIVLSDTCQQIFHAQQDDMAFGGHSTKSFMRHEIHYTITLKDMETFSDYFMTKKELALALRWLDSHYSTCVRLHGPTNTRTIVSMGHLHKALKQCDKLDIAVTDLQGRDIATHRQKNIIVKFICDVVACMVF